jgi:hypothetical protein
MTKISDTIKSDHRELEECHNNILNARNTDEKTRWQNQFCWELARHSIGEELVLYPAFERHLPNGKEIADKDRQEHLSVKNHLKVFQNLSAEDPKFESTLSDLWKDLSEHIKEEENDDLPKFEEKLQADESESLSTSFGRTKMFVPSRSHPSAPDKPPFETVAGLLAAPFDHLSDLFRKFPQDHKKNQLPP